MSWFSRYIKPEHRFLVSAIAIAACVFFFHSSFRHFILRSTALDLGFFDNLIYKASQGEVPIEHTLKKLHLLGDHAAWIFYLIALLYKIYPTVQWLFGLQALALSGAAWPLWVIARQSGLAVRKANLVALVYLLYPIVFNVVLLGFYTDTFAPFLLFSAIALANAQILWGFIAVLLLLSGCKAVFSLTIMALGVWLCVRQNRNFLYGGVAIAIGLTWLIIASQIIVPAFGGGEVSGVERYAFLGNSLTEIILNLFLKPHLFLSTLWTVANLKYVVFLLMPVLWGLHPRYLSPFIGLAPLLFLNIISTYANQKDFVNHYSMSILPFLMVSVVLTMAQGKNWLQRPHWIIAWSLLWFLILGKPGYLVGRFVEGLDTVPASRDAIALIDADSPILVPMHIAPHLTHRDTVNITATWAADVDFDQFKYILLDEVYPGFESSPELVANFLERARNHPDFELIFERDRVYLFEQKNFDSES